MAVYGIGRQAVTPVAAAMLLSLTTGLQEIAKTKSITVDGHASSDAKNTMAYLRSTTNLVTPTAQTPSKHSSTSPAAYTDAATTATTEPVTAAIPALWERGLQAFGGQVRQDYGPGDELIIQGATAGNNEVSLESTVGTSVVTCHIDFEEV